MINTKSYKTKGTLWCIYKNNAIHSSADYNAYSKQRIGFVSDWNTVQEVNYFNNSSESKRWMKARLNSISPKSV